MLTPFARRTRSAFIQTLLLIGVASGVVGVVVLKIYQKLSFTTPGVIHELDTACGCLAAASLETPPSLFLLVALGVIGAIAASFLLYCVYQFIRLSVR
ncbi:hypothetical protein HZA86_03225, partial [Candidatus Uhrbacteria bacterium]|nr:hypothetical protein [Candidatus Uhrbacteria bacterium]